MQLLQCCNAQNIIAAVQKNTKYSGKYNHLLSEIRMLLRYPITSYGSHHVELTGGLLTKFEDYIIAKFAKWAESRRISREMGIMSDRELAELGLCRHDIAIIADGKFEGGHDQRRA
jgi:uncharacterized protein YjiS (DUF1127 family)